MPVADEKFVKDIVAFYEALLGSIADSIVKLSEIQLKHKEGYEHLKEVQLDPAKLFERFKDMDPKQKGNLLAFFMQASVLEERLVMLFKLDPEQQKKLANDIREFLESYKTVF